MASAYLGCVSIWQRDKATRNHSGPRAAYIEIKTGFSHVLVLAPGFKFGGLQANERKNSMFMRFGLLAALLIGLAPSVRGEDPQPFQLNTIRMYVPIPQLEDRFGNDVKPLVAYIGALQKRLGEILAKEKQPPAKGLLIAVGIKSKKSARVWCQAVDGEAPAELLRHIEKELGKLEAVDLKLAPAGFALEVHLFGRKPDKYPEFPDSWVESAKKTDSKILIPPDDLFKVIWPD